MIENCAIIIPALNEEDALRHLLPEIPRAFARWVIVVDNGSSDGTASVAENAGAIVVRETRRGYGRACLSGFDKARELGADLLIFMDGDGSDDPADLPVMLKPLVEGRADFVIGSRVSKNAARGAVPPQARLGNWLVSTLIRLRFGAPVHDIGSFRALPCSVLESLEMREMTYGWPVEMVVKAARAGYRMVEVPLHYRPRSHGRSKVAGTITGSVRAAYSMLKTTFRYAGAGMERVHG